MRLLPVLSIAAIAGAAAGVLLRPSGQPGRVDAPPGDGGSAIDQVDPLAALFDAADAAQGVVMPGSQMTMSPAGLAVLQQLEGFSATPYPDAGGQSIGYGHFIEPGESFTSITPEEGAQLLAADVAGAERAVRTNVHVPLTQSQFDALVSFTYNVGEKHFRTSTLLKKLNAGDYTGALAEFPKWNESQGKVVQALVDRRAQEQQLFEA